MSYSLDPRRRGVVFFADFIGELDKAALDLRLPFPGLSNCSFIDGDAGLTRMGDEPPTDVDVGAKFCSLFEGDVDAAAPTGGSDA
jgi:hypothetical protein